MLGNEVCVYRTQYRLGGLWMLPDMRWEGRLDRVKDVGLAHQALRGRKAQRANRVLPPTAMVIPINHPDLMIGNNAWDNARLLGATNDSTRVTGCILMANTRPYGNAILIDKADFSMPTILGSRLMCHLGSSMSRVISSVDGSPRYHTSGRSYSGSGSSVSRGASVLSTTG